MNYTYIEQLLERYWDGNTTLEEERILKSFFSQNDVPETLRPYADYFNCLAEDAEMRVSDDFDKRFENIIAEEEADDMKTKAIKVTFRHRIMPFLQAAAAVAVILTVGGAALRGLMSEEDIDYGDNLTSETYIQKEEVKQVLETVQRNMTAKADSIKFDQNTDAKVEKLQTE